MSSREQQLVAAFESLARPASSPGSDKTWLLSASELIDMVHQLADVPSSEVGSETAGDKTGLSRLPGLLAHDVFAPSEESPNTSIAAALEEYATPKSSDRRAGITLADTSPAEGTTTSSSRSGANSSSGNGEGIGDSILSATTKIFASGLGLVPLISGLFGLFGGGDSTEPPPLLKYIMPNALHFSAADTAAGLVPVDYDQTGLPRLASAPGGYGADGTNQAASSGAMTPAPTQVHVNVNAMDARSFLDHSNEIAQAVRQAMLNLNSINDVVSDL